MSVAPKTPANYKLTSDLLAPEALPPNLPFVWRARMQHLRALALKAQKLDNEALEACYDTVSAGVDPDSAAATPSEHEWLYRAGFLGLDILEQQQQWEAAAQLGERLSNSAAPLAQEAASRANRIRLQHYLWDGKK
jgi:hypothetical protein